MDPPITSTSNATSTPAPTAATTSQLTEPPPPPQQSQSQSQPPPPQPKPQQTPQPTPQTPSTTPSTPNNPNTNPNPNPNPSPSPSLPKPSTAAATAATTKPQIVHRPWQHPHPHSHLASTPSGPSISSSSTVSPPIPSPRGLAIGVPAPSPGSFSSTFGHHISGLNRPPVNVPESLASTTNPQVRPGMISNSQMRPHQQRPSQLSIRPPPSSPSNPSPTTQNFQGHGFIRSSPVGTAVSPVPSASQGMQTSNQPWLSSSSASQVKPPLPSPSYRPQMNSPSMQQRSHIQQPHHSLPTTSHVPSAQLQQPFPSHQQPEHSGQQFPSSRVQHSSTHPQPALRVQGSVSHKPSSLAMSQPNATQSVMQSRIANTENDDAGNRILSKRSINELLNQIDPSEKLDPEVEDILADIADEFVVSATTFGCSLAKHRKSDTLEAKDILLHLDRNWNMTLPGFSGDEIKSYRKQVTNDIHKERLAAIKKSVLASEMANAKNSVGQAATNAKSNMTKTNVIVSPNLKVT